VETAAKAAKIAPATSTFVSRISISPKIRNNDYELGEYF
jgi:hypothetical protein